MNVYSRRQACGTLVATTSGLLVGPPIYGQPAEPESSDERVSKTVQRGLEWLARNQSGAGHWEARGLYRMPLTAMAGIALLCESSTTTQGRYSRNIRRTVDWITSRARPNGLIGEPTDRRYTYGHGFAMLFLSQLLGEEEDIDRRQELLELLSKAVRFSGRAQTPSGGWGYVSSNDSGGVDEGSTTVTQVQGLRGCRNAGIAVSKEVVDKAIGYIQDCTLADGGVCYSSRNRNGSRPAITAAAIACLFNAGEYDSKYVPRLMNYTKKTIGQGTLRSFWHYAHYYYAQVMYRQGGAEWEEYKRRIFPLLISQQAGDGSWSGNIGPVYITAINLTILQLEKGALPIYQR